MGHEIHQKDSYNFSFGMIGGRKNKYNSPGPGKPSKPGKHSKPGKPSHHQEVTGHNNNYNINSHVQSQHPDQPEEIGHSNNHFGQSQAPQHGVFVPAPAGAYACAYAAPYPYQCPPQPYPHQGGYHGNYNHVQGYPGSFVPHQGGYGNHGGAPHMDDIGLVGAAAGVAAFGMFKLLRERRRHGGGRY